LTGDGVLYVTRTGPDVEGGMPGQTVTAGVVSKYRWLAIWVDRAIQAISATARRSTDVWYVATVWARLSS
jgi:hypothetical protein